MKTLNRSFAGGEITPEMYGRLDLGKFQTGLATCLNGIVLPHGPVARRPGFQYVNAVKNTFTLGIRLIPFAFSATQTMVLEVGPGYIRFHTQGKTLLETSIPSTGVSGNTISFGSAHGYAIGDWVYITDSSTDYSRSRFLIVSSVPTSTSIQVTDLAGATLTVPATTASVARVYTLTTPYAAADVPDLHYTQNADVLTLVHPNYPAYDLQRLGAASWTLTAVSFAPSIAAPVTISATATVATGTGFTPQKYVVTSIAADGVNESVASTFIASCSNNLGTAGNYNTIAWTPVGASIRHNVYKLKGGIFGYIGQTAGAAAGATVAITAASQDVVRVVTVTTGTAHGFSVGNVITVSGTGVASMNGTFAVTAVVDATHFKYTVTTFNFGATTTTGTVGASTCSIIDDNILPDTTKAPPENIYGLNASVGAYPTAVAYHEQRRWFAGTASNPQTVWATRNGTQSNLTSSFPSQASDGLQFSIASRQQNAILHLVPLQDLIALTVGGEFRIFSDNSPAITPTTLTIKTQGYTGAANVQPQVTANALLYVQAGLKKIREMSYNWQATSYQSADITLMAPHLFERATVIDMAYAQNPTPVLWVAASVSGSAAALYGLTYVPDQQIYAWHKHIPGLCADGFPVQVQSVCVVREGNEDVLYSVCYRLGLAGVNGGRATIERLSTRFNSSRTNDLYADCGVVTLTDNGTANLSVSGLWHLEGQTVQVFLDNAVHPDCVVANGSIILQYAGYQASIGLKYNTDLKTLPLALLQAEAGGQGIQKNASKVAIRVTDTSVIKAGPSFTKLLEAPARQGLDPYDSAPSLKTQEIRMAVIPSWNSDGSICIRQDLPLPMTVLSVVIDFAAGG